MVKKVLPQPLCVLQSLCKNRCFVELAMQKGFDAVATGHYARQREETFTRQ